ncbi:MAG: hypothetical protein R3C14_13900 [Caldilineaceae bacterium]
MPLTLNHRKPVALFTYLLVTGQEHMRDSLAALFWPNHEQAKTFLRNNLYIIRKALGPMGEQWLHTSRDTVLFQPNAAVWVDLWAFRT